MVWLRAIYNVDLQTYAYDPSYQTDLKAIAQFITDGQEAHDDTETLSDSDDGLKLGLKAGP